MAKKGNKRSNSLTYCIYVCNLCGLLLDIYSQCEGREFDPPRPTIKTKTCLIGQGHFLGWNWGAGAAIVTAQKYSRNKTPI
jgi:hypothetical protein